MATYDIPRLEEAEALKDMRKLTEARNDTEMDFVVDTQSSDCQVLEPDQGYWIWH